MRGGLRDTTTNRVASAPTEGEVTIRWPKTMDKAKIVRDANAAFPEPAIVAPADSLGKKGKAPATKKTTAKKSKRK